MTSTNSIQRFIFAYFVLFVGSHYLTSHVAEGCSFIPRTLEEQYESADAVFAGDVVSLTRPLDINGDTVFEVRVTEVWKGDASPSDVLTLTTCGNSACCGETSIAVGEEWILFPVDSPFAEEARVGLGGGNRLYDAAVAAQLDAISSGSCAGDDPAFALPGNKDCGWVASGPDTRCKRVAEDGTTACAACCDTCSAVDC